jgi:hypothetical protein
VLVDLGVEANYVKRRLTLKINVLLLNEGVILLVSLDGKRIYLYRDYIFKVAAKDSLRDYREYDVRFMSYNFNLDDIDVILKYP